MKPDVRNIAESVRLDAEWTEIRVEPPLQPREQVQRISIEVDDVASWGMRPDDGTFVDPEGTPLSIDVELVDEDGERVVLDSIGLGPGLTFTHLPEGLGPSDSRLPHDERFPTLRLRADRPFEGGAISWICITNY